MFLLPQVIFSTAITIMHRGHSCFTPGFMHLDIFNKFMLKLLYHIQNCTVFFDLIQREILHQAVSTNDGSW